MKNNKRCTCGPNCNGKTNCPCAQAHAKNSMHAKNNTHTHKECHCGPTCDGKKNCPCVQAKR